MENPVKYDNIQSILRQHAAAIRIQRYWLNFKLPWIKLRSRYAEIRGGRRRRRHPTPRNRKPTSPQSTVR